jgi:hypothetical protein
VKRSFGPLIIGPVAVLHLGGVPTGASPALLLILGAEEHTTQGFMDWSGQSMPARYQHLVKQVQTDIAKRQGDLVWGAPKAPESGPTAPETATDEPEPAV